MSSHPAEMSDARSESRVGAWDADGGRVYATAMHAVAPHVVVNHRRLLGWQP